MTAQKISGLPAATTTADADLSEIVQGGTSKKRTNTVLRTYLEGYFAGVDDVTRPFSVVVFPDTQNLTINDTNAVYFQQAADWIAANKETRNIQLVTHVGDIVDVGNVTQFDRAIGPLDTILATGIPFVPCVGNHDYDGAAFTDARNTATWNTYLPQAKFTGEAWWDGAFYDGTDSDNFYTRVELGGRATLVLSLECFPRDAVMTWAEGIIGANLDHDVIIMTHAHLHRTGVRAAVNEENGVTANAIADGLSGEDMWNRIRRFPNVMACWNGHHITTPNVAQRADWTDGGSLFTQQYLNWQAATEGGQGRIVLFTVDPRNDMATRQVWNSKLGSFDTATGNDIKFRWRAKAPANVRRSFLPESDSARLAYYRSKGLRGWFDSTDPAAVVSGAGGATSQWSDKSGNDYHAVQATGTRQPILTQDVHNGMPGLLFDGVDDSLSYVGTIPDSRLVTQYVVAMIPLHNSTRRTILDGVEALNSWNQMHMEIGVSNKFEAFTHGTFMNLGPTLPILQPVVFVKQVNINIGEVSKVYQDGRLVQTSAPATLDDLWPAGGYTIGRMRSSESRFMKGYLFQIIDFAALHSEETILNISRALAVQHGGSTIMNSLI